LPKEYGPPKFGSSGEIEMLVMADETSSLVCIDEIAPNTDQKKPQESDEDYFNKMIGKR
jgi:hypothetical protein